MELPVCYFSIFCYPGHQKSNKKIKGAYGKNVK